MEWSNPYLTLVDQSFVLPGLSSERARLDIDSESFDSPRSQKNSLPVINIPHGDYQERQMLGSGKNKNM